MGGIAWKVSEIIEYLLFSWLRSVWHWMKVNVNILNTWCILMSEAVAVPSLMMMTSMVSEESLAWDRQPARQPARQTDTHTHTHTQRHTQGLVYVNLRQVWGWETLPVACRCNETEYDNYTPPKENNILSTLIGKHHFRQKIQRSCVRGIVFWLKFI